jgi:peptidoglycan L-alanyl-D-glutamate endopeptidase CwlK
MYNLGKSSLDKLSKVHPDLARVVSRAITITEQDFTVVEGLRTLERQKQLVADKKSQTLKSRHLTGHAVDLAPWVNGTIDWNGTARFDAIAEAVRQAAIDEKVEVLWGASWSLALNYHASAAQALDAYVHEREKAGRRSFIDRPHFQLTWRSYP